MIVQELLLHPEIDIEKDFPILHSKGPRREEIVKMIQNFKRKNGETYEDNKFPELRLNKIYEKIKSTTAHLLPPDEKLNLSELYNNHRETFNRYRKYFLLRSRIAFEKNYNEFGESIRDLLVLEQFEIFLIQGRENNEDHEFKTLKKDVLDNFVNFLESSALETITQDGGNYCMIHPIIEKFSWIEDDKVGFLNTFLSHGWEAGDLEVMKNTVLKIQKEYLDRSYFPEFSSRLKTHFEKLSEPFISSSDVVDKNNTIDNSFGVSVSKEAEESFRRSLGEHFESSMKKIFESLFQVIRNSFVVDYELDEKTKEPTFASDDGNRLKYFGHHIKNRSEKISNYFGYGLFYKEFTSGGFLNRKSMFRPFYYGPTIVSVSKKTMMFHGDRCKKYSTKDGTLEFEGSFRNGKKEGKGKEFVFTSDKNNNNNCLRIIFEGRFFEDSRHGRGESIDPVTGEVKRGMWENGILKDSSVFKFECPTIHYNEIKKNLLDTWQIGKGGFGVVYKMKISQILKKKKNTSHSQLKKRMKEMIKNNNHHVAVKILKVRNRYESFVTLGLIRRGIGLCNSIRSKHILESFCIIVGPKEVGYVMELCEKSIDDLIGGEEPISLSEKLRIIKETAVGMKALHFKNIMHRDLKWANVMLNFDGVVKLTDFDTLKEDEVQWRLRTIAHSSKIGTPGFRSPEVYIENKYTLKCDVYAFGLMIYALLWEEKFPYISQFQCSCGALVMEMIRNQNWIQLEDHIARCNLRPLISHDEAKKFPDFLIDLMIQCWDQNPFNRPSFEEINQRFEFEERKQFSKITLQFPTHKGVNDQKMYLSKPYQRIKIIQWIERKFNQENSQHQRREIVDNNVDKPEEDSSSMYYLDGGGEEKDEEKKKKSEDKDNEKERTKVLLLEHSVMGTVELDEDIEKIIETEQHSTFQVRLNHVDESIQFLNNIFTTEDIPNGRFRIQLSKLRKENKEMREENELLRRLDLENKMENENIRMEFLKLKSFLEKNCPEILKKFEKEKLEEEDEEEEEGEEDQ